MNLARSSRGMSQDPFEEKPYQARTLGQRLKPTIDAATRERNRAARKARISGWAINIGE